MKKLKILEMCLFSAGICGVWNRVKEESLRLAHKGYEVRIFSSNAVKGSNELASQEEKIDSILIQRFPFIKYGGESFMGWDFEKAIISYKPDIIIVHSYRHLHTTKALKIAKKLNAKIFLVTHAPFARESSRTFLQNTIVKLYDFFIGKRILKQFNKVIAITKWEVPYLKELGLTAKNIEYIPNGIPEEFFRIKRHKEENKVLFLGRISPIKSLETLIQAVPFIKDKKIIIEIVGPYEQGYMEKLRHLVKENKLEKRIIFTEPIFDIEKKIKKIDSCKIFVLPSKSEGMPQALVEAMARGKIAIASNNLGAKDLIENNKNGYLFPIGNYKELARKINLALSKDNARIKAAAESSVKKFGWPEIINKIENLINLQKQS